MELFRFGLHADHNEVNLKNIEEKRNKYGNLLIFACFFLYTSSMAVKGVFAAETQYIVSMWELEYATASMANTCYFVAYGLVQVLLFLVMSKINLKKVVCFTVPIAVVSTILMGVTTNIMQMWAFFGLTGAFQASIYCGCNYVLTENLPVKLLSRGNKVMNLGYAFGTVVSYGLCGIYISFDLWRVPYFILGGVFGLSILLFAIIVTVSSRFHDVNRRLDKKPEVRDTKQNNEEDPIIDVATKKEKAIFYSVDLVITFLITALYYSIMNYITPLLVKVHGLSQDVSIYVTIIAPIAIALGPLMTINSCDKNRDFIRQAIYYSLIALPLPLLLALFYEVNVILALVLSVGFIVITNGVKAIALSVITFKMRKKINAGSYSAISNAIASLSAGVTPTLIGAVIDNYGWQVSYFTTFTLAVVVVVSLIIIDLIVRKFDKKRHEIKETQN